MVEWTFVAIVSPLGVARAVDFEELAGVVANSGALHSGKILISLNIALSFNRSSKNVEHQN